MSTQEIYNYHKVDDNVITGGQPTAEQLKSVSEEGFETVVNLATERPDSTLDEAGLVRSLGMAYYHIPVEWNDPKPADFESFENVIQGLGDQKTLIHCAANFRVTAFFSLYAMKHLGWSEARADAFRMLVWQGSDFPVWEKFIRDLKAKIMSRSG
jgi:protein tyrosine phosphatase (PTP) superfamily phosphohydrolase (DUF442 family)